MLEPPDVEDQAPLPPRPPPGGPAAYGRTQIASNITTATDAYEVAQAEGTEGPTATAPKVNPRYPSEEGLARIIYNETSSLLELSESPSLDELRKAMAHAVLNRIDQHTLGDVARGTLSAREQQAIFKNKVPSAVAAYKSSLAAAKEALARTSAPLTGAASAVYYNNRPDNSTGPNRSHRQPLPFVATFGPYRNVAPAPNRPANSSYFAFFGNPE